METEGAQQSGRSKQPDSRWGTSKGKKRTAKEEVLNRKGPVPKGENGELRPQVPSGQGENYDDSRNL